MVSRFHEMVAPSTFLGSSRSSAQAPVVTYTATDESCLPSSVGYRGGKERVLRNMYKVPDDTTHGAGCLHHELQQVARGRFVTINKKNSLSVPIIPLAEVLAHPALAR
jgi:hypothetical protein